MSDLIRREDAIASIKPMVGEFTDNGFMVDYERVLSILENAPSADLNAEFAEWAKLWFKKELEADRPQGEWIPCSERLPSEQGQYLVTTYAYNDYHYVDVLSFHKGKFYETDSEWGDIVDNDVVAWMPLPKPYGERKGD